jgi:O-antigen/teichoic acid export membrane protein
MGDADGPGSSASTPTGAGRTAQVVARNAFWLLFTQLLNTPMSVLLNALTARGLGAEEFGTLYLASTFVGFAALLGELGQGGALQAAVAHGPREADVLVGSSLAMRLGGFVFAHASLGVGILVLGYSREVCIAAAILSLQTLAAHFGSSASLTARGLERTDLVAANTVIYQVMNAVCVIPTLLLGGKLTALLVAQLVAAVGGAAIDWGLLRRIGVRIRLPDLSHVRALLHEGSGFLFLGVVLALQSNVDAVILSKLAPENVIGWHAAARRLVGFLIFPVVAVGGSLYPTLCRLRTESPAAMQGTMRSALKIVAFLVIPVALGCGLFAEIGIQIFSRESYGPAVDNVRVLSVFVFVLYFSMVLGTYLNALGKQRQWAFVQLACVAVSAALDPVLIPYFQRTHGNGGLGVAIATCTSELLMLVAACVLAPRGLFERTLLRPLALAALSGGAMAFVAWLLRWLSPWLAAPVAVSAYAVALRVTGALDDEQLATLRELVRRKRSRA